MTKQRFKALFLHLICSVMLAVQWVPAHAHLDAAHQHNGPRHEHDATIHAHQPATEHGDALDLGHIEQHLDEAVVDLDQSYCASAPVLDQPFTAGHSIQIAAPTDDPDRFGPFFDRPSPDRTYPHVGEPRAPPQQA